VQDDADFWRQERERRELLAELEEEGRGGRKSRRAKLWEATARLNRYKWEEIVSGVLAVVCFALFLYHLWQYVEFKHEEMWVWDNDAQKRILVPTEESEAAKQLLYWKTVIMGVSTGLFSMLFAYFAMGFRRMKGKVVRLSEKKKRRERPTPAEPGQRLPGPFTHRPRS